MEVPEHLHDSFRRLQMQMRLHRNAETIQGADPYNMRRLMYLNGARIISCLDHSFNVKFEKTGDTYTFSELNQIFHN